MIIAGNQVNYVSLAPEVSADDVFYSQLTLPVASFEALKNNYNLNGVNNDVSESTSVETPSADVESPSILAAAPETNQGNFAISQNVNTVANEPVIPQMTNAEPDVAPIAESVAPTVEPTPTSEPITPIANVTPIMPEPPQSAQAEVSVMNEPVVPESSMPTSLEEDTSNNDVPVDFTADKEAFLKACENMFDALVAKFNK